MFEKSDDKSVAGKFLKSVLDSTFNGIMTFESVRDSNEEITDFKWLFVNDVAESIVSMRSIDLVGKNLLDIMPANKEAGLFAKYCHVVETGESITFEQYYGGEGIDLWFRIMAVKLDDGFTVTFQDITDLKNAIKQIEAREQKYQQLFKKSLDAVFLMDQNYGIVESNDAFNDLLSPSYTRFAQIFSDEFSYNKIVSSLGEFGKVDEEELDLVDENGEIKNCVINIIILLNRESQFNNYLCVIRDMTKRKLADKQLLLAEKLSMTGKLARTIAHEVRNPLTNVSLALEQLKDEIGDEAEDSELYFNIIERNSNRIGTLISDLLNSSKPKALNLVNQSLNEHVKAAVDMVKDRCNLSNIQLDESYAEGLNPIQLDKDQIKTALINLLINAIEAMVPGKGILKVKTEMHRTGAIHLKIADNGKGISKENIGKLFEPFFTSKKEGAGLGLTTVQNIIHSHKGQIEVVSEPGLGTTFLLKFFPVTNTTS